MSCEHARDEAMGTYPAPKKDVAMIGTIQCISAKHVHANRVSPMVIRGAPTMADVRLNSGSG